MGDIVDEFKKKAKSLEQRLLHPGIWSECGRKAICHVECNRDIWSRAVTVYRSKPDSSTSLRCARNDRGRALSSFLGVSKAGMTRGELRPSDLKVTFAIRDAQYIRFGAFEFKLF
jgi:hypothetical protein